MSNVTDEFNAITEHFSPRVIAMANGQYFKLAKFKGEFPFHAHAEEDEFFLVHRGTFTMCYRDREVVLKAGDSMSCRAVSSIGRGQPKRRG